MFTMTPEETKVAIMIAIATFIVMQFLKNKRRASELLLEYQNTTEQSKTQL